MINSLHEIENRSRLFGSGGSVIIILALFLLLFYSYLPKIQQHSEEFIMVSYGDSEDGGGTGGDYGGSAGGNIDESGYATQQTAEQPIAQSVTKPVVSQNNAVVTQDDLSGAYAKQQEAAEAARQKAIREAEAARAAEARRIESRVAGALANSEKSAQSKGTGFDSGSTTGPASGTNNGGGHGTNDGVGDSDKSGRQGNPAGSGVATMSKSLQDRGLKEPFKPNFPSNVEGKISVDVVVNAAGTVTSAVQGKPTNISDPAMIREAVAAAYKAKFTSGDGIVRGTITYLYKLN